MPVSYLKASRNYHSFFEKLSVRSLSYQNGVKSSLTNFDKFFKEKFDRDLEHVIHELISIKDKEAFEETLQTWINWNEKRHMALSAIKAYYGYFLKYLRYRGLEFSKDELRDSLEFPQEIHEMKHGLTKEELRLFIDNAKPVKKALYLVCSSAGLRLGEAIALKKRDLDFEYDRVKINIPARITKTKRARFTFISQEAERFLTPILKKKSQDDLIFEKTNETSQKDHMTNEQSVFSSLRKKLGFTQQYEDSRVHLITSHSFRAYFVTACEKVNTGLGHALAGHDRYMKQYERFSVKDLLEFYKKVEGDLMVYEEKPINYLDSDQAKTIKDLTLDLKNQIKGFEILSNRITELEKKKESS